MIEKTSIIYGVVANAVWYGILQLPRILVRKSDTWIRSVAAKRVGYLSALLLWTTFLGAWEYLTLPYWPIVAVLSGLILASAILSRVFLAFRVGILGIDPEIRAGIDYTQSLRLCRNSLSFLGTGARKLTQSGEFEAAIRRCTNDARPIRFLLSHPENPLLENSALQFGVDREDYRKKVRESLQVIMSFRNDKKMNIQVRLYPCESERDIPLFRLMFIDDDICLVSYNVYGKGDGSQLPQLVLFKARDENITTTFYFPFLQYFDRLWEVSHPIDTMDDLDEVVRP